MCCSNKKQSNKNIMRFCTIIILHACVLLLADDVDKLVDESVDKLADNLFDNVLSRYQVGAMPRTFGHLAVRQQAVGPIPSSIQLRGARWWALHTASLSAGLMSNALRRDSFRIVPKAVQEEVTSPPPSPTPEPMWTPAEGAVLPDWWTSRDITWRSPGEKFRYHEKISLQCDIDCAVDAWDLQLSTMADNYMSAPTQILNGTDLRFHSSTYFYTADPEYPALEFYFFWLERPRLVEDKRRVLIYHSFADGGRGTVPFACRVTFTEVGTETTELELSIDGEYPNLLRGHIGILGMRTRIEQRARIYLLALKKKIEGNLMTRMTGRTSFV